MKTDDLIKLLATQPAAERQAPAGAALARAVGLGLLGGLLIMLAGYGTNPALPQLLGTPMFWFKLGMPVVVALSAARLAARLARPGMGPGRAGWGIALAVALVWIAAVAQWQATPAPERAALLWGQTWLSCPFSIGLIGLPVLVGSLRALRELAPTRLRLAGAAAGALAGGAGAAVYALHCPEFGAPFLAVWYVLGMALPVAAGAWLGPRVLRW
ncbi:MAG: DUF1109 domain-containing protein [Proteobacteria bacterium]|nr:DUF1109 domain-containing protein [Pseudomonadota bacterium]